MEHEQEGCLTGAEREAKCPCTLEGAGSTKHSAVTSCTLHSQLLPCSLSINLSLFITIVFRKVIKGPSWAQ